MINKYLLNWCANEWWIHTISECTWPFHVLCFCFCGLLSLNCSPSSSVISENLYFFKFWFTWFLLCDTLLSWVRINYASRMFLWWLLFSYPLFNLINIILWTAYLAGTIYTFELTLENVTWWLLLRSSLSNGENYL